LPPRQAAAPAARVARASSDRAAQAGDAHFPAPAQHERQFVAAGVEALPLQVAQPGFETGQAIEPLAPGLALRRHQQIAADRDRIGAAVDRAVARQRLARQAGGQRPAAQHRVGIGDRGEGRAGSAAASAAVQPETVDRLAAARLARVERGIGVPAHLHVVEQPAPQPGAGACGQCSWAGWPSAPSSGEACSDQGRASVSSQWPCSRCRTGPSLAASSSSAACSASPASLPPAAWRIVERRDQQVIARKGEVNRLDLPALRAGTGVAVQGVQRIGGGDGCASAAELLPQP